MDVSDFMKRVDAFFNNSYRLTGVLNMRAFFMACLLFYFLPNSSEAKVNNGSVEVSSSYYPCKYKLVMSQIYEITTNVSPTDKKGTYIKFDNDGVTFAKLNIDDDELYVHMARLSLSARGLKNLVALCYNETNKEVYGISYYL
ncbi:hypothetical protein [Serratia surfactantfaciens]|uniref:hypothetical protein n=1 Tax=Serratia surfactantfaciens TaxID=2741499 RepID=UPI001B3C6002|nr:hypothetical protein [Serratia surfactantfaciens]